MGYSYSQDDQKMCFNNAKNWQLGWFSNETTEITLAQSYVGNLKGQVNYGNGDTASKVIVKVKDPNSSRAFYIGYNHRVKHNSQSAEAGNQVTIQEYTGSGYAESNLIGKISAGGSWSQTLGPSTVYVDVSAITTNENTGLATVTINYPAACTSNADCDDGIWCNGAETCNTVNGQCEVATPACDDGLICTDDVCTELTQSCSNVPVTCPNLPGSTGECLENGGCQFDYGATLETWEGISGTSIANLNTAIAAGPPNRSERLDTLLEGPTNYLDNYGSRLSGWLVPPVTGDYTFWIATDDAGEFWLSTDAEESNKVQACFITGWAGSRDWTKFASQQSAPISLVAGQAYYYEALQKEGAGGDNLAIAWQYTGQAREVIPAIYSSVAKPDVVAPTTAQPTNAPTTAQPTNAPTTAAPTTAQPTNAPTTAAPTTAQPTNAPTTAQPTNNPTTAAPTTAQPTNAPTTAAPTTAQPTNAPTTAQPTNAPTPFNCASIGNKGACNNDLRCTWSGNPNSGSCGSGGGEPPAPSPPSPTPPPTGGTGCDTCGNGQTCCAPQSCETSGPSWRRACV